MASTMRTSSWLLVFKSSLCSWRHRSFSACDDRVYVCVCGVCVCVCVCVCVRDYEEKIVVRVVMLAVVVFVVCM